MKIPKIKFTIKKECTVLSGFSKSLILLVLASLIYLLFCQMPLYLSKSEPVKKGFLVIDGNLPDYALDEAIKIFKTYNYQKIIATGGDFHSGHYISGKKSMPELTRATLIELGLEPYNILVLECGTVYRNRTQTSSFKLNEWIVQNNSPVENIDILTVGCHAQRSRKLFQYALGDNYNVGVWSVNDRTYDITEWWKTSKGARTVISEIIAYCYTWFFLVD